MHHAESTFASKWFLGPHFFCAILSPRPTSVRTLSWGFPRGDWLLHLFRPEHSGCSRKMEVQKKNARGSHYHKHKINVVKFLTAWRIFSASFNNKKIRIFADSRSFSWKRQIQHVGFFLYLRADTKINTHTHTECFVWFSDGFSREEGKPSTGKRFH